MKCNIGLVFFVSIFCVMADASQSQELFLRANKYYKERAYAQALEEYMAISDKSSAVWYNSGNCLYHLGKYVDALVAYKRAYAGATHVQRDAIDYNVTLTKRALSISPVSVSYAQRVYNYLVRALENISLFWLQILFLVLLYCAVCLYRFNTYKIISIILAVVTIFFAFAVGIKYYDAQFQYGIVTKQASIFVGPDKKYDVSGAASLADELIILEKRAEWYKVKKGTLVGWIPAEVLAEIY